MRFEVLAEQIEARANQSLQIASDAVKAGENPNAAVAALRVELENKRWLLAKQAPATYADLNRVEMTGAGGTPLIPAEPLDISKLALAMLNVFHAAPGGKNRLDALEVPASATTLLSGRPVEPAEPEPVPVEPMTPAAAREHVRYLSVIHGRDREY